MERVLIVDDDARIREFMSFLLGEAGYRVVTAGGGREARRLLAQARFDLIVTDILMPECDGIDLILDQKHRWDRPRILAVSGGGVISANDYLENADVLGADGVLRKPFTGEQLLGAVSAVLRRPLPAGAAGTLVR